MIISGEDDGFGNTLIKYRVAFIEVHVIPIEETERSLVSPDRQWRAGWPIGSLARFSSFHYIIICMKKKKHLSKHARFHDLNIYFAIRLWLHTSSATCVPYCLFVQQYMIVCGSLRRIKMWRSTSHTILKYKPQFNASLASQNDATTLHKSKDSRNNKDSRIRSDKSCISSLRATRMWLLIKNREVFQNETKTCPWNPRDILMWLSWRLVHDYLGGAGNFLNDSVYPSKHSERERETDRERSDDCPSSSSFPFLNSILWKASSS